MKNRLKDNIATLLLIATIIICTCYIGGILDQILRNIEDTEWLIEKINSALQG